MTPLTSPYALCLCNHLRLCLSELVYTSFKFIRYLILMNPRFSVNHSKNNKTTLKNGIAPFSTLGGWLLRHSGDLTGTPTFHVEQKDTSIQIPLLSTFGHSFRLKLRRSCGWICFSFPIYPVFSFPFSFPFAVWADNLLSIGYKTWRGIFQESGFFFSKVWPLNLTSPFGLNEMFQTAISSNLYGGYLLSFIFLRLFSFSSH